MRRWGVGGGTLDFDRDGWSDLYLVAAGGIPGQRDSESNALMRNLSGNFTDVSLSSDTGNKGFGQGVAVGDVNADGFPDLLVLNYGPNALLLNNGDGTFSDATESMPSDSGWSTSAAIADLDGDGISDFVVLHYCDAMDPVTHKCPSADPTVFRSCSPLKFPGRRDRFLQGTPQGLWQDCTDEWGIQPETLGRGLGVMVGSLDSDPGNDVYIANDMTNNHYWSRLGGEGALEFSDSAMLRGLGGDDHASAQGSMGIASDDLDNDGDIDLYVTNFSSEYNTYYEQRSAGTWQDRTAKVDLSATTFKVVGFGTEAIDLDHDGMLELVVSNGHVDMFSRGNKKSIYAHPMQVFRRNSAGPYNSIAEVISVNEISSGDEGTPYLSVPHVGRALWKIDADGDGRADLVVTHQTEPVALLMNRSKKKGSWIAIDLHGRSCSRDAIGAIVRVTCENGTWIQTRTSGDGFLCSNEPTLRFGLGKAAGECEVEVTWPDGWVDRHHGLTPNRAWTMVQADKTPFLASKTE